ncbi:hypothetical protein GGH93_003297 [Coemansia aciculifera]|nr:hypothetical protein GGH93_003297 [Coemansia aciculifera]
MTYRASCHKSYASKWQNPYQFRGLLVSLIAAAVLAASLLLTGIPLEANDRVFAQTHRDLDTFGNRTHSIDQIVVIGDAGGETDDHQRAKLCGGNLWIDHLSEALGADLVSYAHGYEIRRTVIGRNNRGMERVERVKTPLARYGAIEPIYAQALAVANTTIASDMRVLYIIIADPSATAYTAMAEALAQAANDLILGSTRARRLLIIDTPTRLLKSTQPNDDASMRLAESIVTDPSVKVHTFSASRFLQRMQSEYYKYGLRFPDHPCVLSQAKKCRRPDRFFWCEHDRVGTQKRKGLGLAALSAAAFAVMTLLVRILSDRGMSSLQIMVWRCVVQTIAAVLVCRIFLGISPLRVSGGWKRFRWVLVRAVFGSVGHLLYYVALSKLPMGIATVLFFTNPLFTALLARLMLGESFSSRHSSLAALCLAGIALVVLPIPFTPLGFLFDGSLMWSLCALLGAATVALAYVSIRKAGVAVHAMVHVTYFGAVGAMGSLALAAATGELYSWQAILPNTALDYILVVGVGLAAFAAQFLMNWGLQLAPAGPAVMMRNSDIVITFILDAVLYRTVPGLVSMFGAVIITGCVISMGLM